MKPTWNAKNFLGNSSLCSLHCYNFRSVMNAPIFVSKSLSFFHRFGNSLEFWNESFFLVLNVLSITISAYPLGIEIPVID